MCNLYVYARKYPGEWMWLRQQPNYCPWHTELPRKKNPARYINTHFHWQWTENLNCLCYIIIDRTLTSGTRTIDPELSLNDTFRGSPSLQRNLIHKGDHPIQGWPAIPKSSQCFAWYCANQQVAICHGHKPIIPRIVGRYGLWMWMWVCLGVSSRSPHKRTYSRKVEHRFQEKRATREVSTVNTQCTPYINRVNAKSHVLHQTRACQLTITS